MANVRNTAEKHFKEIVTQQGMLKLAIKKLEKYGLAKRVNLKFEVIELTEEGISVVEEHKTFLKYLEFLDHQTGKQKRRNQVIEFFDRIPNWLIAIATAGALGISTITFFKDPNSKLNEELINLENRLRILEAKNTGHKIDSIKEVETDSTELPAP